MDSSQELGDYWEREETWSWCWANWLAPQVFPLGSAALTAPASFPPFCSNWNYRPRGAQEAGTRENLPLNRAHKSEACGKGGYMWERWMYDLKTNRKFTTLIFLRAHIDRML